MPGKAPRRAKRLAIVSSPPLSVMIDLMNVPSADDLFADLFAKQLGHRYGHEGTIAAGARVISGDIASGFDLHLKNFDGSGSRVMTTPRPARSSTF